MDNEKKPHVISKIIRTVFYDFHSLGLTRINNNMLWHGHKVASEQRAVTSTATTGPWAKLGLGLAEEAYTQPNCSVSPTVGL